MRATKWISEGTDYSQRVSAESLERELDQVRAAATHTPTTRMILPREPIRGGTAARG